jgi:Na+/melibiose symporter-like transporter
MPQIVDPPGQARIRLGAWMMIAGTIGAVLAVLTWLDVWNASDTKPVGWAIIAALCAVLALAGFATCFKGLQEKAQAAAAEAPQDPPAA